MSASAAPERRSHAVRWTIAAVVVAALVVFAYIVLGPRPTDFAGGRRVPLDSYHEQDPTGVPPELKAASIIERGEYLTRAADCAVCHTAKDGVPFAGGRAFVLPFGTLYSTNITPDPATGITLPAADRMEKLLAEVETAERVGLDVFVTCCDWEMAYPGGVEL